MRMGSSRLSGALVISFVFGVISTSTADTYDAVVNYVDGRTETVSDVWEYFKRQPVRELCYLDEVGKAHTPHVLYGQIVCIDFAECKKNPRLNEIRITLHDGSVQEGLLWGNDSLFGTDAQGNEWRGRIVSIRKLTFKSESPPVQEPDGGE